MIEFTTKIFEFLHSKRAVFVCGGKNIAMYFPNVSFGTEAGDLDASACYAEISVRPIVSSRLQSIGQPRLFFRTGLVVVNFYFESGVIAANDALGTAQRVMSQLEGSNINIDGNQLQFTNGSRVVPLGNDPQRNNRYSVVAEVKFNYQEIV